MTLANQIPSNLNVPLFYLNIGSNAAVSSSRFNSGTVLFGVSTGDSANDGEFIAVGTVAQGRNLFGNGSQLSTMIETYRQNNRYGPLYAVGQSISGNAASRTLRLTFVSSSSASGTLVLYVGGRRIAVSVSSRSTAASICKDIRDLVNSDETMPFKVIVASDCVPLPVHRAPLTSYHIENEITFETANSLHALYQHRDPQNFITPGTRYKLDPRNIKNQQNVITSSVYYIPYADTALYRSVDSAEYSAVSDIFINTSDSGRNLRNINDNNIAGAEWTIGYANNFNSADPITDSNYPGDIELPINSDYIRFISKWEGKDANDYSIKVLLNSNHETIPAGLGLLYSDTTVVNSVDNDAFNISLPVKKSIKFDGGTGDLTYDADLIKELPFHLLVYPENAMDDAGNFTMGMPLLNSLEDRWAFNIQNYGHGIGAIVNNLDYSKTTSHIGSFSSPAFSVFHIGDTATPPWECAAALSGAMFNQVSTNPKLPYNGIVLYGVRAPSIVNAPNMAARERLLKAGISTTKLVLDVVIERPVTGDPRWRDLSRRLAAAYIAVDVRDYVLNNVGRAVLADDDTIALPGSGVITPSQVRSLVITRLASLVGRGYLEEFNEQDVIIIRSVDDQTRLDAEINVDPTNPLYILASQFNFGN